VSQGKELMEKNEDKINIKSWTESSVSSTEQFEAFMKENLSEFEPKFDEE